MNAPSAPGPDRRGLLIAFEGGDGAGKSTQIRLLEQALRERLPEREVVLTREPGGSALGERIRELVLDPRHTPVDARTEALLFAASRSAHVERTLRPALRRGAVVLTDRYVDSSVAYQGAGRQLGTQRVLELNRWAADGLRPDLTVLLDVPAGTGRQRRAHREPDRMEQEESAFHERVHRAFRGLAVQDPEHRLVLDGCAPVQEVAEAVRTRVLELLEHPGARP